MTDTPSPDLRSALEPCPNVLCGSQDVSQTSQDNGDGSNFFVECSQCKCRGPEFEGSSRSYYGRRINDEAIANAIAAWNRRALALASDTIGNGGGEAVDTLAASEGAPGVWTDVLAAPPAAEPVRLRATVKENLTVELPFIAVKDGHFRFIVDKVEGDIYSGYFVNRDGKIIADKALASGQGGRFSFHKSHFAALATPARTDDAAQAGGDAAAIREKVAGVIEGCLERHGVDLGECEGTLDDADEIIAILSTQAACPTGAGDGLPADVVALVVAGREAWEIMQEHQPHDEVTAALFKALERFTSRVCYDDDGGELPEAHANPCTCGAALTPADAHKGAGQ